MSYQTRAWRVEKPRFLAEQNETVEESVGGSGGMGEPRITLRLALRALGRKARLAHLVEERAVADLQNLGGFAAVPLIGLENFQDNVVLHFPGELLRNSLERDIAICGRFVREMGGRSWFDAVRKEVLLRIELHVARHAVLQLADVSGPIPLLQHVEGLP